MILLVDNSAFMRMMMKKMLLKLGKTEIDEAESGEEAVEKVKKGNIKLVFLDMVMGGMSGLKTLEEIKKINPDVKVVMVTVIDQEEMIKEAKEKGADGYLIKPVDEMKLFSTLEELEVD
jgi:two-component system chemotaxis response regulator CheY